MAEVTIAWGEDTSCASCLCALPAGAPAWMDGDAPLCCDCAPTKESRMPKLRPYAAEIARRTGTEDTATLTLIEQLMRDDNGGVLDHLTADDFRAAIPVAIAGAAELAASGLLDSYCDSYGIAGPAAWTEGVRLGT
jgi:hypothetical protein